MKNEINEIRINPEYAHLITSEYEGSLTEDSVPVIRKNMTNTGNYMKKLAQRFDKRQQIFPPNCRYIENTSSGTIVVIEEPPAYRTIKVDYSMSEEIEVLKRDGKIEEYGIDENFYTSGYNRPYKFTLAFPYVIFMMMFDRYNELMSGQVYLRNARLSGPSDYLLKMPMMNISSEGNICYGSRLGYGDTSSLTKSIENTIMVFWSATFNDDYLYNYHDYRGVAGVNTYIGWQELSQKDPMFIYNVDWIKMQNNFRQQIEEIKRQHNAYSNISVGYDELERLFSQPEDSGKDEPIQKGGRRKLRLFYDIAQGIYLTDTFYVHVGDPIMWKGKKAFIDSFIGFFDSDRIRYVRFELEGTKELVTVKFTNKMADFIYKGAKQLRFEEEGTMKNGTIIKENDIITMKNAYDVESYGKVFFIRKARDGQTEARIGSSFYILENVEGEICDTSTLTYKGMKLVEGNEYIVCNSINRGPFHSGYKAKYKGVGVDNSGNLNFEFTRVNKFSNSNIQSDSDKKVFSIEDTRELPPVFYVGRRMLSIKYDGKFKEGAAWATPCGVVYDRDYEITAPSIADIEKSVLTNNGSTFHIESFNSSITFDIGDKVVHADWENPMNMLNVKTITAFTLDKSKGALNFILSDRDGNLTTVEYMVNADGDGSLKGSKQCSLIKVGKIRKITNQYRRVSAGTKIQATKKGYPHFPKKDVNIIIGFITDTGGEDPLVLCSNCCTLWYSDMMENFKRTTMKSKKWPELQHTPIDISKIQFQAGDIISDIGGIDRRFGYLVVNDLDHKVPRVNPLRNYYMSDESYILDKYIISRTRLDCIPNPRIGKTAQTDLPRELSTPNFHGLFYENPTSYFKFLDDGRSYVNV